MSFKIKVPLFLFLSFVVVSIVFAFTFSGFDQPLKPYKKLDKSGIEQSYSWENSNPLGDSWGNYLCDNNGDGKKEEWCCCLYRGHLGEDWVLSAKTDVDNNDISKAEIGQSVYSIADGVIFKVANWPECPRDKSHGWGGVVLVKHQIPDDIDKKFNLTNTILPNPKETEEAKKAEQKRVQGLEEKGTKVVYSMYGHLKNIQVKEGDTIKKGDKVGEIGEVCYEGSTKKYSPHLHFEIKNQNAIDKEDKIGNIPGIGHGYSGTNAYAPDRYIPSNFIENNKNLIVEEKPITQPQPSPPVGLTGGNDNLSFWDKIVFYWNGFVANVKEIFGGSTGEVQVAKPEVQQQTNNGSASSPSAGNDEGNGVVSSPSAPRNDSEESPRNDNNKPEENSSPPVEPEVWNQKFISYKLDEKDKDNGIYQLTLRFQNTGNTTWTKDDVSLNVVGGYQGIAAKFYHQSWTTKLRPTILTTTINPGDIATFTFTLQFPKDPNTYYPQFQPVRYIKDINDFSWIGTDKAIFLAEVKQSSSSALTFAGASVAEVINNDNDNAQNPPSSSPPPPNNTPPPTEEPDPTTPSEPTSNNPAPSEEPRSEPSFTYSPQREYQETKFIAKGESITFDATNIDLSSFDSESISYEWDFGGGEENKISGGEEAKTVSHIYSNPGTYTITLTVKDNTNKEITFTQEITVKQLTANVEWEKTFGGLGSDYGYDVQQTTDGGYIIVGSTYSFSPGGVYLIKTDKEGEEQWYQTFGDLYDVGYSVRQVSDNGYAFISNRCLIKVDNEGNKEWENCPGSKISLSDFVQTSDGYIYVGYDNNNSSGRIIKIKTTLVNGEFQNVNDWVGDQYRGDYNIFSIEPTIDGYIVAGTQAVRRGCGVGSSYETFLLAKIDEGGTIEWQQKYRGEASASDVAYAVKPTSDGGYILVGITAFHSGIGYPGNSNYNILLIKTTSNGTEQWRKVFDLAKDEGYDVIQTTDDGYVIIGNTTNNGDSDIWLIKTDPEGNKIWDLIFKSPDGNYEDLGRSVKQTTDGGYIIVGTQGQKSDMGNQTHDIWLIKLYPEILENLEAETIEE